MTTANALSRSIKDLLNELLVRNLILLPNAVIVVDGARVTWRSPTPVGNFVDFVDYPTIRTYRRWAETGQYSALQPDAALLQLTYDVAHGEIAGHHLRMCRVPIVSTR